MVTQPAAGGAAVYAIGKDPVTDQPSVLQVDATTGAIRVVGDGENSLVRVTPDFVAYADSSADLTTGTSFTGVGRDTGDPKRLLKASAYVHSDNAGKLEIQQSDDNTIWRTTASAVNAAAGGALIADLPIVKRYWRVRYTNTDGDSTTALDIGSMATSL